MAGGRGPTRRPAGPGAARVLGSVLELSMCCLVPPLPPPPPPPNPSHPTPAVDAPHTHSDINVLVAPAGPPDGEWPSPPAIPCHKIVLASRGVWTSGSLDDLAEITLDGVNYDTALAMFRWVYTDHLEQVPRETCPRSPLSPCASSPLRLGLATSTPQSNSRARRASSRHQHHPARAWRQDTGQGGWRR